jgi:predicted membrane protein
MKTFDERHNERLQRKLERMHRPGFSRMALGILLLGFGALILVRSLGIMTPQMENIIFSWQMFLIALGILFISKSENRISGTVLILVGGFFMLNEFADLPFNAKQLFWASLFILVGIMILFRGTWHPFHVGGPLTPGDDSLDYVDELNVFGGSEKRIITKNFKGGKITNIFGGSTLDFSEASLAEGKNVLDVVSIFGGFKLIIPHDWTIKLEVTSILGGIADKRTHVNESPNPDKMLIIRGSAIFGGGEIKNY